MYATTNWPIGWNRRVVNLLGRSNAPIRVEARRPHSEDHVAAVGQEVELVMGTSDDNVFQKYGQSIVGAVLLALLLWTGSSLIDIRDRLGRMEVYQINATQRDNSIERELIESKEWSRLEFNDVKSRIREIELANAKNGATNGTGKYGKP